MSSQVQPSQRLRPFKPVRFGRYTLLMPISTGGMGEIYLARLEGAQGFEKLCVIKKILPHLAEDADFVERFVNEARILVKLSHGNIAQVLDMGVHEGAPYIALEFIDGKDLRRIAARMRDRKLPIPLSFVLYAMMRVLDALAYAHRKKDDNEKELNLVHRDVSPQNVLISYEGEVKVIDFGLAKSTMSSTKTNPSIILGKFMYMSPEQARHNRVDRRSDLYAVGLCLYELIAGKNPFDDIPPGELMAQVASPQIVPLSQVEPLCPAVLAEAVMKALNPDPAQRFQTAEELRARLQAILLEIDPNAGPETSTRFMREAFAVEYHAERKMLTALREQARQLPEPEEEEEEASPEAEAAEPVQKEPLRALPEVVPPVPSPSFSFGELPNVEQLSFQPTRKGNSAPGPMVEEFERETLPSIQVGGAAAGAVTPFSAAATIPMGLGLLEPSPDPTSPTPRSLQPVLTPPTPLGPEPSVLVEGLDKHTLPSPEGRLRTLPEVAAMIPASELPPRPQRGVLPKLDASGQPVRRVGKSGVMKAPKVGRTGEGQKAERLEGRREPEKKDDGAKKEPEPKKVDRSLTPLDQPVAVAPSGAPAKKKSSGSIVGWLVIPLIALLAVGGYIAWDVYTARLTQQRQLADEQARDTPEPAQPESPRSREVRPPEEALPEAPKKDPPKEPLKEVPKPKVPPKVAAPASPTAKAFQALEVEFNAIPDAAIQRKLTLTFKQVEAAYTKAPDAPETLKKINALHEQIKAELAKGP